MTEAWSMGGYKTDDLTGKVAKIGAASGTLNNSGACMQILAANYQVTAGKTFYLVGYMPYTQQAANGHIIIRYADDAALTTNPVAMVTMANAVTVVGNYTEIIPVFGTSAPAGKYVGIFCVQNDAVSSVMLFGYEA